MIAIYSFPGMRHHKWKWFPRSQKKEAERWLDIQQNVEANTFGTSSGGRVVSDRRARTYLDENGFCPYLEAIHTKGRRL